MTPDFRGIWPILYAFFGADSRLDRAAMRLQVEACIASGAHGIAVLGLATEVSKLSVAERRDVMAWAIDDAAGRVPVAVTVFGEDVATQIAFVREAADLGAAWVILQPPPQRPLEEANLLRFFGRVLDASPIPGAIQNAPQYLGVGLGIDALLSLRRQHPNFVLLKGEAPALEIAATIEALHGEVAVFNGRGGLELPDCLRAGCSGMIPAPECVDVLVAIYAAMQRGDEAEAERLYADVLPLMLFVMQSIPQLICYGKRALAQRLGIAQVHDRQPAQAPVPLGMRSLSRYTRDLSSLRPGGDAGFVCR